LISIAHFSVMANDKRSAIREEDVQGLKYFRKLWPLFERFHDVGCQRDKAGNRQLFMDQYCALVLLFLFNPCVRSLRALQQASELKNVQRKLGCSRSSLGSLSEATDVFDPERLRQIIGELAAEVKPSRDRSDDFVKRVVTAVDGSVVQTLSTIAQAAYLKTKNGATESAGINRLGVGNERVLRRRSRRTTAASNRTLADGNIPGVASARGTGRPGY
jgi:hypothetical protein